MSGRDAVIVACGRLFGRATENGRRWPAGDAWDATLAVEGLSDIGDVLAAGKTMRGPKLAVSELFDVLPVALLRAQYVPARRERPADRIKPDAAPKVPARV